MWFSCLSHSFVPLLTLILPPILADGSSQSPPPHLHLRLSHPHSLHPHSLNPLKATIFSPSDPSTLLSSQRKTAAMAPLFKTSTALLLGSLSLVSTISAQDFVNKGLVGYAYLAADLVDFNGDTVSSDGPTTRCACVYRTDKTADTMCLSCLSTARWIRFRYLPPAGHLCQERRWHLLWDHGRSPRPWPQHRRPHRLPVATPVL